VLSWKQESAFNYYSETKTGFGFNLKPVSLNRMQHYYQHSLLPKVDISKKLLKLGLNYSSYHMSHAEPDTLLLVGLAWITVCRLYIDIWTRGAKGTKVS